MEKPRPRTAHKKGELPLGVKLLYEDDILLVVDKPAGLLTVSTAKESERTLFRLLRDYLGKSQGGSPHRERTPGRSPGRTSGRSPGRLRHEGAYLGVVHRLDRETSGVMIFVKTEEAREKLSYHWATKVHDRRYWAIVDGAPKLPEGTVHNWLKQNKAFNVYALDRPQEGAEEAITHYKVLSTTGSRSLVELKLETGRTNQIRVHMAGLGCPVHGDKKYGQAAGRSRLALHALSIEFEHPGDDRVVSFESPLPAELRGLLSGALAKRV